jgi:hypothetical protein
MGWCRLLKACWVVLGVVSGTAQAERITVTGAFTSFSGVVLGGGQSFMQFCPAGACGGPGPGPFTSTICPDAGCTSALGLATRSLGGRPNQDTTSQLFFRVSGNPRNALIFRANSLLDDASPSRFKLGTLTFTNGLWTADATIGFSIVADTPIHQPHRFTGLVSMRLTPNTGTPQQNADFITLTDAAGNPVVSPLTLENLGSVRAYELDDSPTGGNTVTVDLFGQFGSLNLTDFANPVGDGFLDASITAELAGPVAVIPEPSTCTLVAVALGFIGFIAQRRRRSLSAAYPAGRCP